ncbi:hypothetical protein CC2G_001912 [Coprinopsis cinerea AmutBmut pab1-1]|nr:hypothetical protein CC2G_001912 [Coprinopsis cinerea AmutBmut pab1-1]
MATPHNELRKPHAQAAPRAQDHRVDVGQGDHDRSTKADDTVYQTDGKVWSLYLTEATDQAKEQVELWKTEMESLLLFAGLFAGVVASFLVEARSKLREDEQEALLADIRNGVRSLPPPTQEFRPNTSLVWVNGLWFSSLLITLFSAIMAGLARGWIVKLIPNSTSHQSTEAVKRWNLDQTATSWGLQDLIAVVPFLVQLAFFLFALGLALHVLRDHPKLGGFVLAAVLLSFAVYLVLSFLPLWRGGEFCPLQTPLSTILLGNREKLRRLYAKITQGPQDSKPETLEPLVPDVLTKILYQRLILSKKGAHVDEAFAELSLWKNPSRDHMTFLASSQAPAICLHRLQKIVHVERLDTTQQHILRNYLEVFALFVKHSQDQEASSESDLDELLKSSIMPSYPFHRWDIFPESLRPLAFTIRAAILMNYHLGDLSQEELNEQPWVNLVRNLPTRDRRNFVMVACRCIATRGHRLEGKLPNLRTACTMAIGLHLARTMANGRKSEWWSVADDDRQRVRKLCHRYLEELLERNASQWVSKASQQLDNPLEAALEARGLPCDIHTAISHPNLSIRKPAFAFALSLREEGRLIEGQGIKALLQIINENRSTGAQNSMSDALGFLVCYFEGLQFSDTFSELFVELLEFVLGCTVATVHARVIPVVARIISKLSSEHEQFLDRIFGKRDDLEERCQEIMAITFTTPCMDVRRSLFDILRLLNQAGKFSGESFPTTWNLSRIFWKQISHPSSTVTTRLCAVETLFRYADFGFDITGYYLLSWQYIDRENDIKGLIAGFGEADPRESASELHDQDAKAFLEDPMIDRAIEGLVLLAVNDDDDDVQKAGAKLLSILVNKADTYREMIVFHLPPQVDIPSSTNHAQWYRACGWIRILVLLTGNDETRDTVHEIISKSFDQEINEETLTVVELPLLALMTAMVFRTPWYICRACTSILTKVSQKRAPGAGRKEVFHLLVAEALNAGNEEDIREHALLCILELIRIPPKDCGPQSKFRQVDITDADVALTIANLGLDSLSCDPVTKVRERWAQLLEIFTQGSDDLAHKSVGKLLELATNDQNGAVRRRALESLASLVDKQGISVGHESPWISVARNAVLKRIVHDTDDIQ